jgi:hypothetical protein
MSEWNPVRSGPAWSDVGLYLTGVAGLAASITLLFLGMRAVLDIGGFCAEGGPYEIAVHCPAGVPLVMTLAFPALFAFGGLMAYRGPRIGAGFAAGILAAWPALFLSLGWNFLEYGLRPPAGEGLAWGWLICAIVFFLTGAVPLVMVLSTGLAARLRRLDRRLLSWLAALALAAVAGIMLGIVLFGLLAG